jgi:Pyridine nucleotide-disulphide oxidoreductase, dimerisation domain
MPPDGEGMAPTKRLDATAGSIAGSDRFRGPPGDDALRVAGQDGDRAISTAAPAGIDFRTSWRDTSGWFNTRRVGETTSGAKVLIEQGTDRIVGAHLLGPHANEVINLFAMAIRLRIPAGTVKEVIYAYPTYGSDIRFMI